MAIGEFIRTLAKSSRWQLKFEMAEKFSNMKVLFKNINNFSGLQLNFLKWLTIYESLYEHLAMGEEKINKSVIEDDVRTDAFLVWHRRRIKQIAEENKNLARKQTTKPMEEGIEFINTEE